MKEATNKGIIIKDVINKVREIEGRFSCVDDKGEIAFTPEVLKKTIEAYFEYCDMSSLIPTVNNLSLALGISKNKLLELSKQDNDEGEIIRMTFNFLSAIYERMALDKDNYLPAYVKLYLLKSVL